MPNVTIHLVFVVLCDALLNLPKPKKNSFIANNKAVCKTIATQTKTIVGA